MSEQNKAILTEANAAVVRADYEAFLARCTDDTVWHFIGDRTLVGKAAVREYIRMTYLEPPTFTVERLIAEDDVVIAMGEIRIKDESGRATRSEYCDVWRIHDGKLAELKAYVVEVGDAS